MSTRTYWIIALAFLVGAPVIVNLVTTALPVTQPDAPGMRSNAVASGAMPVDPSDQMPAPPPPPLDMQDVAASADPTVDVAPTLAAEGIAPGAADGSAQYAPAPPPEPVAAVPPPQAVAVAPPSGPPTGPTPALPPPPKRQAFPQ